MKISTYYVIKNEQSTSQSNILDKISRDENSSFFQQKNQLQMNSLDISKVSKDHSQDVTPRTPKLIQYTLKENDSVKLKKAFNLSDINEKQCLNKDLDCSLISQNYTGKSIDSKKSQVKSDDSQILNDENQNFYNIIKQNKQKKIKISNFQKTSQSHLRSLTNTSLNKQQKPIARNNIENYETFGLKQNFIEQQTSKNTNNEKQQKILNLSMSQLVQQNVFLENEVKRLKQIIDTNQLEKLQQQIKKSQQKIDNLQNIIQIEGQKEVQYIEEIKSLKLNIQEQQNQNPSNMKLIYEVKKLQHELKEQKLKNEKNSFEMGRIFTDRNNKIKSLQNELDQIKFIKEKQQFQSYESNTLENMKLNFVIDQTDEQNQSNQTFSSESFNTHQSDEYLGSASLNKLKNMILNIKNDQQKLISQSENIKNQEYNYE